MKAFTVQKIFIIVTIVSFFSSCTLNAGNINRSSQIDSNTIKEIDSLNGVVLTSIANDQPDVLLSIASDSFIAISKNNLVPFLQQSIHLVDPSKFRILDQFDIVNSAERSTMIANGKLYGKHDYNIVFTSITKESAITVGEFENSINTLALTTIYGKYEDGWKLNYLMIRPIKHLNMDAVDWYEQSRVDYKAGNIIDAYNKMSLAADLSKPTGDNWSFKIKPAVNSYTDTLSAAVGRIFPSPISVNTGVTTVSIFHVQPYVLTGSYIPCVYYVSTIDQADTLSLSKECDRVNDNIGKIFKGIDKNKTITYLAYPKIPTTDDENRFSYMKQITK